MTEAELQHAVIELAHTFRWTVAHFRPAQTKHGWRTPVSADGAGFPDLVLVHPQGGIVFAELKSDKGRMSTEQDRWERVLGEAGAEHHVWRPADIAYITSRLSFGRARSIT